MITLKRYILLTFAFSIRAELTIPSKRDVVFPFGCREFYFELFVLPTESDIFRHILKIQWEGAPYNTGDWVGIFKTDPITGKVVLEPMQVIPVKEINGSAMSSVVETPTEPKELGFEGKCLDYYAGYFDKCHTCLAVTCLRIEPDWMWRIRNKIGKKKIKEIFIPGTYESGWTLTYLDTLPGHKTFITQNEGILGQLMYGARYLHVRVTYNSDDFTKWWVVDPVSKVTPLENVLVDIRFFIERTKEIVILDLKEFKGFEKNYQHLLFINYLERKVGDLVARSSSSWDATFDKLWYSGKRLIVAYDFPPGVDYSDFLWTSVVHKKIKGKNLIPLLKYFSEVYENPPKTAWSATLHTPLSNKGLMVDSFNTQITKWFKEKQWLEKSNIVCVNFIKSTGIVRSAIQWNSGECI